MRYAGVVRPADTDGDANPSCTVRSRGIYLPLCACPFSPSSHSLSVRSEFAHGVRNTMVGLGVYFQILEAGLLNLVFTNWLRSTDSHLCRQKICNICLKFSQPDLSPCFLSWEGVEGGREGPGCEREGRQGRRREGTRCTFWGGAGSVCTHGWLQKGAAA